MPTIDDDEGVLVVRVVYDGPPMSGKTTTLRTLARGLGVDVVTPQERDGRTLFFDWVEYVGGLFEGRQIRCQVVSVPGQTELAPRRRALLESADALVVVADTRASEIEEAYDILREVKVFCRDEQPPVGLVLQANKRDAPDRVSRDSIDATLETIGPVAVVETVATTGDGVREAFVFGIRLALDRVRAMADAGQLPRGRPAVGSAKELLAVLDDLSLDEPPAPSSMAAALASAVGESVQEEELMSVTTASQSVQEIDQLHPAPIGEMRATVGGGKERVFTPDPGMPGGFIWPPVDGRTLLHEVSRLQLNPSQTPRGDWWASGGGWRFHSEVSAIYPDADAGRQALVEWARMHATHQRILSPGRTIILADAGSGRFRLWQLVRVIGSLRERLSEAGELDAVQLARELRGAADHLALAHERLAEPELGLRTSLWTISANERQPPVYVGLMPPTLAARRRETHSSAEALLRRELPPVLQSLAETREDFEEVVVKISRMTDAQSAHASVLVDVARSVLERVAGRGASV